MKLFDAIGTVMIGGMALASCSNVAHIAKTYFSGSPLARRKQGRGQGARKRRMRERRELRAVRVDLFDTILSSSHPVWSTPLHMSCHLCGSVHVGRATEAMQDPFTGEWVGLCDPPEDDGTCRNGALLGYGPGHRWMYDR